MAQEVLRFVQTVEEARQRAQEAVKEELNTLDPERLQDDPTDYLAEIIARVLAVIDDTLDEVGVDVERDMVGLGLNANEQIAIEQVVEDAKTDAETSMTAAADGWLSDAIRQIDDMNQQEAEIALRQGSIFLASLVTTLENLLAREADGAVNRVVVGVSDAVIDHLADAGEVFRWVTVQDKRRCDGPFDEACLPRHGQVKPLDEWQAIGLPKGANLVCSIFNAGLFPCRCVLAASAYVVGDQPVAAGEVIARARKLSG